MKIIFSFYVMGNFLFPITQKIAEIATLLRFLPYDPKFRLARTKSNFRCFVFV